MLLVGTSAAASAVGHCRPAEGRLGGRVDSAVPLEGDSPHQPRFVISFDLPMRPPMFHPDASSSYGIDTPMYFVGLFEECYVTKKVPVGIV